MTKSQLHPHTHAVHAAARNLDAVAKLLGEGPKFMDTPQSRLKARYAALDQAAPDVQAWKGRLPLEMIEKLHAADTKK